MVAGQHRLGPQRRQIGAGAGFGITLTPPIIGTQDTRQVIVLLRVVAEGHDHRRHHGHAKGDDRRSTSGSAFFLEQVLFHRRPAGAAMLDRPTRRDPAFLEELFLPGHMLFLAETKAGHGLASDLFRHLGGHESANLLAERFFFGCQDQFHWRLPLTKLRTGRRRPCPRQHTW